MLLTYLNFTLRNFTSCCELDIILRKGYVNKLGVNLVRSSLKSTAEFRLKVVILSTMMTADIMKGTEKL